MAQFDVYRSDDGLSILLDCQSDLLDHMETRWVIPLLTGKPARALQRLHPTFEIDGEQLMLATQLASAVEARTLGRKLGSLASERYAVLNAIDMLLAGV